MLTIMRVRTIMAICTDLEIRRLTVTESMACDTVGSDCVCLVNRVLEWKDPAFMAICTGNKFRGFVCTAGMTQFATEICLMIGMYFNPNIMTVRAI